MKESNPIMEISQAFFHSQQINKKNFDLCRNFAIFVNESTLGGFSHSKMPKDQPYRLVLYAHMLLLLFYIVSAI